MLDTLSNVVWPKAYCRRNKLRENTDFWPILEYYVVFIELYLNTVNVLNMLLQTHLAKHFWPFGYRSAAAFLKILFKRVNE